MQDKQIYAYSWRRDLIKKIKEYFKKRQKRKPTEAIVMLEEPTTQVDAFANQKLSAVKPLNKKVEKENPKRKKKETAEDYFESPLFKKERKEKILTYTIATALIVVFLSGTLMANGIIDFPPQNTKQLLNTVSSPTAIITPTLEDVLTVTPTSTQKQSSTPTNKPIAISPSQTNCKISGCNGEICADESLGEISSVCLYQEKYACYKNGNCERQPDGRCGWTQNSELMTCLNQYK